MDDILQWLGALSGVVAVGLFGIFKKSSQKYVDEKAKNLATLEDTAKITEEVEAVKALHLRQSHAWKWVFEKEYAILRCVWDSTWSFQATARSLRPMVDRLPQDKERMNATLLERHESLRDSFNSFMDAVLKNKPFIPPKVYEICLEIMQPVKELQVEFEMSVEDGSRPDWKSINECYKKLDGKLEELNVAIRKHVHTKVRDAQ